MALRSLRDWAKYMAITQSASDEHLSPEPDESKLHNLSVSGQLFSQDPQERSTKALCICCQVYGHQ